MIPLIRVTILEAFRKYIEQSDYAQLCDNGAIRY